MADIEVRRTHHLGLQGARVAAGQMSDHLARKFGLSGEWDGNILRFERPGVSGLLRIAEKDMSLSITLGFLLKAMKGSIEQAVNQEIEKLFAAQAPKAKKAPPRPKKGA